MLQRAISLNPDDPDTMVALGDDALERGDVKRAEQWARDALTARPEFQDGLVLMGQVYLRQGRIEDAREHALWALRQDATDEGSLRLLASIKARQSPLLGLWWRYAMFMGSLGDGRGTLVLLGAFVVYRFATLAAKDLGQPQPRLRHPARLAGARRVHVGGPRPLPAHGASGIGDGKVGCALLSQAPRPGPCWSSSA